MYMQNGGLKWGVANHFWLKHAALFCLLHVVLKLLCSFCFPPSLHSLNFSCFAHCGHCCLLLATALCNNISVVCVRPSERITVSPTEGIRRQQLMAVEAEGKHAQSGTVPMMKNRSAARPFSAAPCLNAHKQQIYADARTHICFS